VFEEKEAWESEKSRLQNAGAFLLPYLLVVVCFWR